MQRDAPLISVLVPTYNRADKLGRTLQSILDQTFQDFEIIVVDDGSIDDTRAIVERLLQGVSFKYIYQKNTGVAHARSAAIKVSRGAFLAFCDSDDFWLCDKLEKQMALFASDTGLVFSDAYIFTDMSPQLKAKYRYYELTLPFRGEVYKHLARKNFIVNSSVIVRRELLADFILYPITACDDWQMWLSLARRRVLFDYADEPLVYYYEHGDGISKNKIRATEDRFRVRRFELELNEREITPDASLIRDLRLLLLKDRLLLDLLRVVPDGIMGRLNNAYYTSPWLRKASLKMGLGS